MLMLVQKQMFLVVLIPLVRLLRYHDVVSWTGRLNRAIVYSRKKSCEIPSISKWSQSRDAPRICQQPIVCYFSKTLKYPYQHDLFP